MKIFPAFKKKNQTLSKMCFIKTQRWRLKNSSLGSQRELCWEKNNNNEIFDIFFLKEKLKPSKRASWGYGSNWCHSERCAVSLRAAAPGGDGGIACVSAAPLP